MRIVLVYFSKNNENKILKISEGFKKGLESMGHNVDIINGKKEEGKKITGYKYVIIGTEIISFIGGKISESISRFISASGISSSKNAFAFVTGTLFGARNGMLRLMKIMEKEGLLITSNEIIDSANQAELIGKKLFLE